LRRFPAAFLFQQHEHEVEGQEYQIEDADPTYDEVEKIIKKWKNTCRRTQRLARDLHAEQETFRRILGALAAREREGERERKKRGEERGERVRERESECQATRARSENSSP